MLELDLATLAAGCMMPVEFEVRGIARGRGEGDVAKGVIGAASSVMLWRSFDRKVKYLRQGIWGVRAASWVFASEVLRSCLCLRYSRSIPMFTQVITFNNCFCCCFDQHCDHRSA